jgi:hypothetical protein
MPPKAAKAQIRYALTVTGASMRDASAVPVRIPPPAMLKELFEMIVEIVGYQEVSFLVTCNEENSNFSDDFDRIVMMTRL